MTGKFQALNIQRSAPVDTCGIDYCTDMPDEHALLHGITFTNFKVCQFGVPAIQPRISAHYQGKCPVPVPLQVR